MNLGSMHGAEARRLARAGQIGAVALGVSAAALWALDVPGVSSTPVTRPVVAEAPKPPAPPPSDAGTAPERDTILAVAHRLDVAVVKAPPPKPVEPPKAELPPPEPDPTVPEVAYLGPIIEPNRMLAIISIDGTQKIVCAGKKIGNLEFLQVERDKIHVKDGSGERTIERKPRSDTRVAWVSNMPANTPMPVAAVGNAQAAQARGGAMSPEVAARLRERGIDPNQIQRMRDLARERRGGGPGGGNFGQPGGGGQGGQGRIGLNGAVNLGSATLTSDGPGRVRLNNVVPGRVLQRNDTDAAETPN